MPITIFGASNFTTAAWGPDTSVRGTWDLIQTCIITLSLCVYTALHLNVFHRECPWWARCLIRLKWTLIALLAPEFVVFNAWFQRRQAGRIARMLRRRYGQPEPESYLSGLYRRLKMRWEKGNPSGEENGVPGSNTAEVSEDVCTVYIYPTGSGKKMEKKGAFLPKKLTRKVLYRHVRIRVKKHSNSSMAF